MFAKKTSALLAAAVLAVGTTALPVCMASEGADKSQGIIEITPFWSNVGSAVANISASGRTLSPSCRVEAKSTSTSMSGYLYLERQTGSTWEKVETWAVSGTGTISASRSHTVTSSGVYRSRIFALVGTDTINEWSTSVPVS